MKEMTKISVDRLHPHPDNPRKNLGDLTELSDSIKANGIFQNLTVVPDGDGYTVIIGHRRLAAAKLAGLTEVPCVITEMSQKDQVSTMLLENMQRSDLTVYEQAQGFQMMLDLGSTVEEIAEKSGFSKTTVRRRVKMMELDQGKLKEVSERQLRLEDFDELAKIEDISDRNKVLDCIGTADFNRSVANAISKQNAKKNMSLVKKWLKEVGAKEISANDAWKSKYESVKSYISIAKWCADKSSTPPTINGQLFYVLDGMFVSLYKLREKQKGPKKSKEELEQEQKIREAWKVIEEQASISYDLRKAFVENLTVTGKNRVLVMKGAVAAHLLEAVDYNSPDREKLGELFGYKTDRFDADRMEKAINGFYAMQESQIPTLIYTLMGDGEKVTCTGTSYKGDFPEYKKNIKLQVIYDWLVSLGYELSSEEKAMLSGEHDMYKAGSKD